VRVATGGNGSGECLRADRNSLRTGVGARSAGAE
jgi:hypothetical protein